MKLRKNTLKLQNIYFFSNTNDTIADMDVVLKVLFFPKRISVIFASASFDHEISKNFSVCAQIVRKLRLNEQFLEIA